MGVVFDLFLLVGAAVLAGCAAAFASAGRAARALRRDGVRTVGRVRKVRCQTTAEGYERRRVTIEFGLPDGRTVELLRPDEGPEGGRYQVGDEVTVLYHPSRPGRGLAVHPVRRFPPPPGECGLALLSLACALGAASLLVLMF
ncbi:DUF3592 domain-containing protein [Kitasatospora sp. NPDC127059]|uniref:DUF3592 domain-containing protein n=1 Tax=unclassified Kitasatospora TaxID=2633591 RepID=UPI0036643E74